MALGLIVRPNLHTYIARLTLGIFNFLNKRLIKGAVLNVIDLYLRPLYVKDRELETNNDTLANRAYEYTLNHYQEVFQDPHIGPEYKAMLVLSKAIDVEGSPIDRKGLVIGLNNLINDDMIGRWSRNSSNFGTPNPVIQSEIRQSSWARLKEQAKEFHDDNTL